jgi:hypothetical protein
MSETTRVIYENRGHLRRNDGQGVGHWAIFKDAESSPEFPWFVEHRTNLERHDLAFEHFEDDHEYGSFATFEEAAAACEKWYANECDYWERSSF